MPDKWTHHVWTEYLVAEMGNAAVRSAKFNEKGERDVLWVPGENR